MATPPPFDAVLLLSFGGPEAPEDVLPFLENVTRGRGIPRDRLDEVAARYLSFDGRSPINDECRKLLAALQAEMAERGPSLPIYWGNRNWKPMLADTVAQMSRDGIQRAVAVATSAYSSYSACRQYLDDIEHARAAVGSAAPIIEKLVPYWNHASFLETMIDHTHAALGGEQENVHLVFTAHSLPAGMAVGCDYAAELAEASRIVADAVAPSAKWDLVYQSRSGPPSQPWLGPDVRDHIRTLAADGVGRIALVPIGFVADHMEVVFDLDVEARAEADALGITMSRAACVGSAPRFVAGLRDLVAAHIEGRQLPVLGNLPARTWPCAPGCCPRTSQ